MYTICWIDIYEDKAPSIPLCPATADVAHAFVVLTWEGTKKRVLKIFGFLNSPSQLFPAAYRKSSQFKK